MSGVILSIPESTTAYLALVQAARADEQTIEVARANAVFSRVGSIERRTALETAAIFSESADEFTSLALRLNRTVFT